MPEVGDKLVYTDLKKRQVSVSYVAEHDPTMWKVKLLDDSAQLGKKAGELAHIAVRFLGKEL